MFISIFSQSAENIPSEIEGEIFQQLLEKGEYRTQYFKESGRDFTMYPNTELGLLLKETWTEKKEPVKTKKIVKRSELNAMGITDPADIKKIAKQIVNSLSYSLNYIYFRIFQMNTSFLSN